MSRPGRERQFWRADATTVFMRGQTEQYGLAHTFAGPLVASDYG